MLRSPIHKPVRNLSGIGQAAGRRGLPQEALHDQLGVAGARSNKCFAAPGPLSALVFPLAFARVLAIRIAPARFRTRGQGHTPAPRMRDTELNSSQTCFRHPHRLVALAAVQGSSGCFATCGFLDVSFLIMDDKKKASALSRAWTLAYAQPADKGRARTEPQPGPLYDLVVVGLFLVLGIAYFV